MASDTVDTGRTVENSRSPALPILLTRLIVELYEASKEANSPEDTTNIGDRVKTSAKRSNISDGTRPSLLTLHLLYPYILLDALDLIDRGCVIHLRVGGKDIQNNQAPAGGSSKKEPRVQHDEQPPEETPTQLRSAILSEMETADATDVQMQDEDLTSSPNVNAETEPQDAADAPTEDHPNSLAYSTYYVRSAQAPSSRFASTANTEQSGPYVSSKGYAVHLSAWSCSCPAFAYTLFTEDGRASEEARVRLASLLKARQQSDESSTSSARVRGEVDPGTVGRLPHNLRRGFGGLSTFCVNEHGRAIDASLHLKTEQDRLPACCKHLLACVLAESMPGVARIQPSDGYGLQNEHVRMKGMKGVVQQFIDAEEAAGWAAGGGFDF